MNQPPRRSLREPATDFVEPEKPLLRGWSHAAGAVAAIVVTALLLRATAGDTARFWGALVFGLSMIALYVGSAVYHLGRWTGRADQVLQTIDHANIYIYIAGSYTPLCIALLPDPLRTMLLVLIWALAVGGVVTSMLTIRLPRWVPPLLYVGMGWTAVLAMPTFVRTLPWVAVLLLLTGGISYTVGGVIYALRRPDPFPRIFGFHELFHLLVIGGSASFVAVIWGWGVR